MKTRVKWCLLAVSAAAGLLNPVTGLGQMFAAADVRHNRAIADSPRAREEFPWLARGAGESRRSQDAVKTSESALELVRNNSALSVSPRMLEQYPALARPTMTPGEDAVATTGRIDALTKVRRNAALADSPRMQELHPELSRVVEKTLKIAPLK